MNNVKFSEITEAWRHYQERLRICREWPSFYFMQMSAARAYGELIMLQAQYKGEK